MFHRHIPDIIGKNGATIKAIQEVTGARVTVTSNTNVVNNVSQSRISFAGLKAQVSSAKAVIKELMEYHYSPSISPELTHMELTSVPPNFYNVLIGTKGSEIKHIQSNFKVNLYIPNEESELKHVLLVGPPDNVNAASRYVEKIITQAEIRIKNAMGPTGAAPSSNGGGPETTPGAAEEEPLTEPWMQAYVKQPGASSNESPSNSRSFSVDLLAIAQSRPKQR